jgi:hypothetical protein
MTKRKIAATFLRQQRALEVGKAGYKESDECLEQLEAELKAGRIMEGEAFPLGNGQIARLNDRFKDKSKVGAGLSVRRYEVEIETATDITNKL